MGDQLVGSTVVVGGDGRFFMVDAVHLIIQIAAANGVRASERWTLAELLIAALASRQWSTRASSP